ncbi:MAG: type II secretion system protein GspG [Planctomycetes bacterium]|nr:type II secretion system protein GspG [Planctomycetota bacterium]
MLPSLLLAAFGLGLAHAPLHPAQSNLFLEIDSAKELLAARERAPFHKLFADAEMQKLRALLEGFQLPVQEIVETAFPDAVFGAESPLRALRHASFSASGIDSFTGEFANAHFGFEGVLDFEDADKAAAALGAIDAWKALEHAADATLAKECTFGEQASALHWYENGSTVPGAGLPTARVWLAQDGARLYLGSFETTPEQVAARASGKQPGLADEKQLFAGCEAMSPSSGTPIYRLWSDLDPSGWMQSPALAGRGAEFRLLARSLLPTIFPYASATGVWRVEMRGERFVTESVIRRRAEFEDKGLGVGVTDATAARFVPKEAVGVWITNIDAPALEDELRTLAGALLAKAKDAPPDALKDLPPLAQGLGVHAAFYMLPISSIQNVLPRAYLAVELKDKPKFEAALKAWAEKLALLAPEAKVVDKPYRKLACVSLSFGKEDGEARAPSASPLGAMAPDLNPSPTIVVFEDRVLFSLKKTYAQSETRRIADGKDTQLHDFANAQTFPKDVFEASSMDWGGFFGKLIDIAKGLAPLALSAMGDKAPQIDIASLPGSATLARYFKPTTSWSKRLSDGRIYTHAESSFGPETPMEIGLFAFSAGTAMKSMSARPPRTQPSEPETSVAPEQLPDEAALQTQSALLLVKGGVAIYKLESGKLPEHLVDLLAPSTNFPDGYLAPEKSVPKDGWGHELVFTIEAGSARFQLYSLGPDGKDDKGAGDDVKAP